MKYISTTAGTPFPREALTNWKVRIIYIIFFFAKANPDNEPRYPDVKLWLLELDEENIPIREIGLDDQLSPIISAPDRVNYGYFVDCPEPFIEENEKDNDCEVISKEYFEECWRNTPKEKHQLEI